MKQQLKKTRRAEVVDWIWHATIFGTKYAHAQIRMWTIGGLS